MKKMTDSPKTTLEKLAATIPPPNPSIGYVKLHPNAELPSLGEPGAIGLDIAAFCLNSEDRHVQQILPPRTSKLIRTGIVVLAPTGYFLMLCSRSGLAASQPPIFVANSPGIIDPNYTGECKVILYNGGHETAYVKHGQRIAQLILIPATRFPLTELAQLPTTSRGDKGFGSTG